MKCTKCGTDYDMQSGDNQYSGCPKCEKPAGTMSDRDLAAQHAEAVSRFDLFWDATIDQRENMQRRRNYYDGRQWTDGEKRILKSRNQPPAAFNYLAKKVDYLDGVEIETRTDPKPRPRTPTHEDDVQAAEDGLRYACDAAEVQQVFSKGWDEKLVEGICGAVIEHEVVGKGDTQDIRLPVRYMHWDRLYYDPHSREPDFSDALFRGCFTWMDMREAMSLYAKRKDRDKGYAESIDAAMMGTAGSSGDTADDRPRKWSDPKRKRVMICEEYYQDTDENGEMCWYTRHFTSSGFVVAPRKTGYVDDSGKDVCPLEMDTAFVDGDGDTHERYGLVERMMWPQDTINKRHSKSTHAGNSRQTIAEEGAVLDVDKFKNESAKVDGVMIVQKGALSSGRIKSEMASDIQQSQVQMLMEAKDAINQIGPDAPLIATAAASSGRERQIMQQSGMTGIARMRDGQSGWKHRVVTQLWWRIRQFWTYEMWRRVQDESEDKGYRFVGLNRPTTKGKRIKELMQNGCSASEALDAVNAPPTILPDAMKQVAEMVKQNPQAMQMVQADPEKAQAEIEQAAMMQIVSGPFGQEPFTAADVARLMMDIVLDEAPDVAIIQQEEAEGINKIGETMIAAGQPFPLEMAIEASSLRADKKKKLLSMIEKARQPDPQMQGLQQQMAQLQAALAQANVLVAQTQAELNHAKAAEASAKAASEGPKAEAASQHDQALALKHAADAGAKAGGGSAGLS